MEGLRQRGITQDLIEFLNACPKSADLFFSIGILVHT